MVWTPLFAGLLIGGVYYWGIGKDRPKQIATGAAMGGAGGAVIGLLIGQVRAERERKQTGALRRTLNAEHARKSRYGGWSAWAP